MSAELTSNASVSEAPPVVELQAPFGYHWLEFGDRGASHLQAFADNTYTLCGRRLRRESHIVLSVPAGWACRQCLAAGNISSNV